MYLFNELDGFDVVDSVDAFDIFLKPLLHTAPYGTLKATAVRIKASEVSVRESRFSTGKNSATNASDVSRNIKSPIFAI